MSNKHILEDLGNNLILRRSTVQDAEALGKFNGLMHADPGEDFAEHLTLWVKELLSGKHPTFNSADFTIVEDTSTGEIVSSLCLIDQTWAYEGIPFPVGRPELVATRPDYRRRGLVRKQFEVVHQWSAARGHKAQCITGIPWYYRQFGYEMTINLGGSRIAYLPGIPQLKEDQEEPFTFREASEKDVYFLAQVYAFSTRRSIISCVRDDSIWLYELTGRIPGGTLETRKYILEDPSGIPVGYLILDPVLRGSSYNIMAFELQEGVSWLEATPAALRFAARVGKQLADEQSTKDKKSTLETLALRLGEDHPAYHVSPRSMPLVNNAYAYYMRVPDLPDFIRTIGPALEARLAKSYAVGYSGEVKLNFFTSGLILTFEGGRVIAAQAWEQPTLEQASAFFPDLTFLQLLFGYRSYDEIRDAYADCYSRKNEIEVLLRILFPRKPSRVYELG